VIAEELILKCIGTAVQANVKRSGMAEELTLKYSGTAEKLIVNCIG
jgi:hypothetical protein